jgi:K+ transporter
VDEASAVGPAPDPAPALSVTEGGHKPASAVTLVLGALGVVFGDIGTSPLYTLRECMHAVGGTRATTLDVLGVLSLIFWSLTMVVTLKYLAFVMRADNHGEGGIFALLAILPDQLRSRAAGAPQALHAQSPSPPAPNRPQVRLTWVAVLVVIGAALLFGDGAITPAISVLCVRVPGAAVFMASSTTHMPPIMMHVVERIRVLPETIVLLTVITESSPSVPLDRRCEVQSLGEGMYRLIVRYGFMQHPRVPGVLKLAAARHAIPLDPDDITYYLGRDTLLATPAGQMGRVTETLFAFLARNSVAADRHFGIPPRQVIEIGLQMDL